MLGYLGVLWIHSTPTQTTGSLTHMWSSCKCIHKAHHINWRHFYIYIYFWSLHRIWHHTQSTGVHKLNQRETGGQKMGGGGGGNETLDRKEATKESGVKWFTSPLVLCPFPSWWRQFSAAASAASGWAASHWSLLSDHPPKTRAKSTLTLTILGPGNVHSVSMHAGPVQTTGH